MRADATFHTGEREAVRAALRERFALHDDEAARLAELAEATAHRSTDLYAFTSCIDERFGMEQKIHMVETMWRIADLLHVPHGAYVHARMRARDAAA